MGESCVGRVEIAGGELRREGGNSWAAQSWASNTEATRRWMERKPWEIAGRGPRGRSDTEAMKGWTEG